MNNPTHPSIREEFEKAFEDNFFKYPWNYPTSKESALWAAKWMAEEIAKTLNYIDHIQPEVLAGTIRSIANELQ